MYLFLPFKSPVLEWRTAEQIPREALENPQESAFWSEFFGEWRAVGGRYVAPQKTVERTVKGRKAA